MAPPVSLMAAGGSGLHGCRLAFLAAGRFSLLGAVPASIGLHARVGHEARPVPESCPHRHHPTPRRLL
ncbi:hypothetical protein ACFC09_18905 [Streptomyces sp. NPDC056161]|uniref:hypothetical protein n=1 Tax=Streptomyces sp. NPDC056161 TaxID=3345732 RepID=UPI0035D9F551